MSELDRSPEQKLVASIESRRSTSGQTWAVAHGATYPHCAAVGRKADSLLGYLEHNGGYFLATKKLVGRLREL